MNGIPTDLEHNTCIFLDFRNISVVLWVSRRTFFRIRKQKRKSQWREGFSYTREGSCFCKNTNRNLHSVREEFHVQEQEFSIGDVRKTNQRGPRFQFPKVQKDESHKTHDRQGELPAATRGNCWGGCMRKWRKGPLNAFVFSPSCLPWPSKEGCGSSTVHDEIRTEFGLSRGNMEQIAMPWPCLLYAKGFKDTGGSQTFWSHHFWTMTSLQRQGHSVRALWVCVCSLCKFSGCGFTVSGCLWHGFCQGYILAFLSCSAGTKYLLKELPLSLAWVHCPQVPGNGGLQ